MGTRPSLSTPVRLAVLLLLLTIPARHTHAQIPSTTSVLDVNTLRQLEELGMREAEARSAPNTTNGGVRGRQSPGFEQRVDLNLRTPRGNRLLQLMSTDIRTSSFRSEMTTEDGRVADPVSTYIFDALDPASSSPGRFVLTVDRINYSHALRGVLFDSFGEVDSIIEPKSDGVVETIHLERSSAVDNVTACFLHHDLSGMHRHIEPKVAPRATTTLRIVELATDADWELVAKYGPQTNSEILAVVALADAVFRTQLGITLQVNYQHAWAVPHDPYTAADTALLLNELHSYWSNNLAPIIAYDTVHLFSGKTNFQFSVGQALFASLCSPSRGRSVSSFRYTDSPGAWYSFPNEEGNTFISTEVFVHELGHVLGAPHDTSCSTPETQFIMCAPSAPTFRFSPGSVQSISSTLSNNGGCLGSVVEDLATEQPPSMLAIADLVVEEGTLGIVAPFLFIDPNGHPHPDYLYTASPIPNDAEIKVHPQTFVHSIHYTPPLDTVIGCIDGPQKEFHYTATVTDPTGLSDSEDGVIIVKNKNTAPTLSALAAAPQLQPGETISRTLAASDPDCDDILFVNTYGNAAAFTSFNSANGAFTWRAPDCAAPAQYTLRFVAVDRQGAHSNAIEFPISVAGGGSLNCEADSDGDGVSDSTENTLGTAPDDPGSFAAPLSSPVYALWNGFLGMINILELVNTSSFEQSVTVTLYKGDGSQGGIQSYLVPAQSQFDVILNTMLSGFAADEIGLVKIEFAGALDGRMFFYRPDAAFGYEFAFGVPLSNPSTRSTAVGFNTFQPSNNPGDSVNIVANWLGLVNLESSPRSFSVYKYNQVGKFLNVTDVTVPPRGRIDIEAGHVNPGSSQVGVNEIHPHDPTTRYLAQLYRYGGDAPAVFAPVTYSFAFPLLSLTPNGQSTSVPISTRFGGENWVELVNPTGSQVGVFVQYLTAAGLSAGTESITLDPHSQLHLFASGRLGAEETGVAVITPTVTNSIVAQSMFYFRDPATGGIRSMYGSPLREAVGTTALGSYNLFLGMESYARLFNSTAAPRAVGVTLRSLGTTLSTHQITIPANGTAELQLHDTATYNTSADSYGVLILEPDLAGSVFADILRVRRNGGALDFVAPTPVR